MEKRIKPSPSKGGGNLLWMLLCLAAGALSVAVLPVYLLLPAIWAATMFRLKPGWLVVFAVVNFAAGFWLYGSWVTAACLAALAALPALAIYGMLRWGFGNAYAGAVGAGLGLAALYGAVCLPGILSGEGAFTAIKALFLESFAASRELLVTLPYVGDAALNVWDAQEAMIAEGLPSMVMMTLCGMACVLALSNLLFFRLFGKKQDFGLKELPPFSEWSIPRSMTAGLALMITASLVMRIAKWPYADDFTNVISVIVGFPLILQGLSVLDFFLKRVPNRTELIRVLAFTVVGLLFILLQTALMVLGCAETLFQLRKRMRLPRPPAQ